MIKLAYWGAFGEERRKKKFFSKNVIFFRGKVRARARIHYLGNHYSDWAQILRDAQNTSKKLKYKKIRLIDAFFAKFWRF